MSTKALRQVVYQYWDSHREDGREIAEQARKELEAIEKAAREWASQTTADVLHGEKARPLWALLSAIAKEAKEAERRGTSTLPELDKKVAHEPGLQHVTRAWPWRGAPGGRETGEEAPAARRARAADGFGPRPREGRAEDA